MSVPVQDRDRSRVVRMMKGQQDIKGVAWVVWAGFATRLVRII